MRRGFRFAAVVAAVAVLAASAGQASASTKWHPLSGHIYFGNTYFQDSRFGYVIGFPHSIFHTWESVAWVAYFNQTPNAKNLELRLDVYRHGGYIRVRQVPYLPKDSQGKVAVLSTTAKKLHIQPGKYGIGYYKGDTELAWGTFRLIR